ncbi:hypothetical protein pb186bvf_021065 [Paramecium bursaria]
MLKYIKAFHIAIQINLSIYTQNDASNSIISQPDNSQLLDQLKIYDLLYQNINHIESLSNKEKQSLLNSNRQNMSSLNHHEIIADGPLHKIGKLTIIKIERAWWDFAKLVAFRVIQFVACSANCTLTGGLEYQIYSGWNDLQIDWGKWGKDKVISLALTLVKEGPSALSELWNGIQSTQTVSILDIMVDGTINTGLYVGEQCMEQLRQVTETFQALEVVDLVINKFNVRNKFQNVIKDIMIQNMPKKVADQILEIAQEALIQSQIPGSEAMENDLFLENLRKLTLYTISQIKKRRQSNRIRQEKLSEIGQVNQCSSTIKIEDLYRRVCQLLPEQNSHIQYSRNLLNNILHLYNFFIHFSYLISLNLVANLTPVACSTQLPLNMNQSKQFFKRILYLFNLFMQIRQLQFEPFSIFMFKNQTILEPSLIVISLSPLVISRYILLLLCKNYLNTSNIPKVILREYSSFSSNLSFSKFQAFKIHYF